jgi:hypothetical protein
MSTVIMVFSFKADILDSHETHSGQTLQSLDLIADSFLGTDFLCLENQGALIFQAPIPHALGVGKTEAVTENLTVETWRSPGP